MKSDRDTKLIIVQADKDPELYRYILVRSEDAIFAAEEKTISFKGLTHAIGSDGLLLPYTEFKSSPKSPPKTSPPEYSAGDRESPPVYFEKMRRWDLMGDPATKLFIVKVEKDPELYYCVTVKTKDEILDPDTSIFTMTYHELAESIGYTLTAFTGFPKPPKSPKKHIHPRRTMETVYEFDDWPFQQINKGKDAPPVTEVPETSPQQESEWNMLFRRRLPSSNLPKQSPPSSPSALFGGGKKEVFEFFPSMEQLHQQLQERDEKMQEVLAIKKSVSTTTSSSNSLLLIGGLIVVLYLFQR